MEQKQKFGLAPFVILTFIYFIVGFMTTVNGQIQGPLQVAFLSGVESLKNTLITLIPFCFFLGYLLNSRLGGKWINEHGYKKTILRALYFMVGGGFFFFLASCMAAHLNEFGLHVEGNYIPYGYFVFLFGSFLMGTSAAISQVVVNPYIASYELPGTQSVQRMNITCAVNSVGTMIAPFFVTGVMFAGVALADVSAGQLIWPFALISLFILIVTLVTARLHLPNIEGTYSKGNAQQGRSIWSFRHLRLGVLAIFFYVGAEVCIGVNVNLHAIQLIESGDKLSFLGHQDVVLWGAKLGIPALLATLYWGGLMVGRTLSSFMSNVSARTQLVVTTVLAILLALIAISTENLWVLISIGLCHSIMWSAIFTLAVKGLGEYTSKASGLFMMGVFGGAVFPLLQGYMADVLGSWQYTWFIVVLCEAVMLYYALWGSRIRKGDIA